MADLFGHQEGRATHETGAVSQGHGQRPLFRVKWIGMFAVSVFWLLYAFYCCAYCCATQMEIGFGLAKDFTMRYVLANSEHCGGQCMVSSFLFAAFYFLCLAFVLPCFCVARTAIGFGFVQHFMVEWFSAGCKCLLLRLLLCPWIHLNANSRRIS